MSEYFIVDKKIMPVVFDKVIEARALLENGSCHQVSEAVKKVGISRGTYYKYKDFVFAPEKTRKEQKAMLSFMIHHETGNLSQVLQIMSTEKANIITINQNIPIHEWASVVVSIDIQPMKCNIEVLIEQIEKCFGVQNMRLIAVE